MYFFFLRKKLSEELTEINSTHSCIGVNWLHSSREAVHSITIIFIISKNQEDYFTKGNKNVEHCIMFNA